jgi:SnoaL-like domain
MTRDEMIDDLIAKEEIRQAMARYSRGIDRRDEKLVRSAYHEDSVDDHGLGFGGSGYDIAAGTQAFPPEWKMTTHFLGQHLIEVDGDRASSEVYFESHQIIQAPDNVEWDWEVGGRYLDHWERRGEGEFLITKRVVVYDWMRTTPNRTPWAGPDHDVPKVSHGAEPLPAAILAATAFGKAGPEDISYEYVSGERLRA